MHSGGLEGPALPINVFDALDDQARKRVVIHLNQDFPSDAGNYIAFEAKANLFLEISRWG